MKEQNEDVTLVPRNRNDLLDDEKKLGSITLTKEEKLVLAKGIDTPLWDVIMKIWRKQRMMQLAAAAINTSRSHEDLISYQGQLKELSHMYGDLKKIAQDFNKEEKDAKAPKGKAGTTDQPPVTGARELISSVK